VKFAICFPLLIEGSGLFGCKGEADSSTPRAVPEVQTVEVALQTVADEHEFTGQAEAWSIVEIHPQVTGIIKQCFRRRRDVKQGNRLYAVDSVPSRRHS
jgi:membrane fusion protein, multidrug efflux system